MTNVRWDCVDRAVSSLFRAIGRFIGKHPGYFVIVPLLLAGLLVTGVQRIIYEDDPEYLFSPENGRSKTDRNIIEELFPFNNSDFDIGRMTKPGRFGRVIIQAKDRGSVLRKIIFDDVVKLDEIIHNITVKWERKYYQYTNLCAKANGLCFENTILDFADRMGDIENKTFMLEYPLMTDKVTLRPIFFAAYLGGAEVNELGYLESAAAINMMYYLDTTEDDDVEKAVLWENKFLDVTLNLELDHIEISQFVSSTLQTELERNNQSVMPFFSITILIMLIFSVVTCMMTDWVRSRPWLGVLGCLSSCFAVAASFGLTMYIGLPFIGINMAAPFLMLGIGMDDTFVLLAAWRRTSPKEPVHHRLGDAFADAAVSITITSLTNFLSFLIGAITPFPCVRIFCLYTAMAVLFTYVYHITFFGGCMAINGYAESRNLHSLVCLQVMPKSLAVNRNCLYRALCTGGLNPDDPDNLMDNEEPYMMSFFKDTVGGILGVWPIKVLIIMIFLGYLAIGIWGCTLLKEGLERRRLSRSDSYSIKFYDMEDNYFRRYPYRIQVVINDTLNFADPLVQKRIESLLELLEGTEYIADASLTECWYREYQRFLADERTGAILSGFNMTLEDDFVRGLKDVFLKFPAASFFKKDIVFNKEKTKIIATRFVVQAMNVTNANQEKEMVLKLRDIVDQFPFPVSLFHVYFIFFDQFILVRETSIQAISVAAAVMMIISLIFIPSASCAVWVAFSIVSIEIGVIGYMTLWNVNLDSISMINLIMCIGFSVDFSAHISYAYITSEETDPEARLRSALHSLGMPIFQGSMSTILGIIALAFAPSYIFLTFFKTVFLVILFGALHGILLLPVLLSMSDSCFGNRKRKKKLTVNPAQGDRGPSRTPQPFFISKDGNTIVTTNGQPPVFIPRPLYSNGKGPSRAASELDLSARSRRPSRAKESGGGERVVHTASAGARTTWGAGASNTRGGKRPTSVIRETNDKDPGLGTSGEESSSGSWKFDYNGRDNDRLSPRRGGPSSVAGPSRRSTSKMEDHVNPAFLPDDDLDSHVPPSRRSSNGSSSAKGRLAAYHDVTASTILGGSSNQSERWDRSKPSTSSRGSPPGGVNSLGRRRESLDWDHSPLASSRNGTDSPLTSHLSRINSGHDYLREFNLHAPL